LTNFRTSFNSVVEHFQYNWDFCLILSAMLRTTSRCLSARRRREAAPTSTSSRTSATALASASGSFGTLTGATNTGDCLDIVANGANDTTIFRMIDSSFTGCDNNGIEVTGNHVTGNGVGDLHTIVLDIDNSIITGSRFYNLWINDLTPLTRLRVRVQDSDLSVSSSGVAVAFDQQPTGATTSAVIDLGGGALGSDGRNCIFGGAIYDLEATQYNVAAENNWWGSARGPLPGKVVETVQGYKIDTSSPLRRAPFACNGDEDHR
jgi:hypothetical protein